MKRICSYIITSLVLVLVLGAAAGTASAAPGDQLLPDPGAELGSGTPTYWSSSSWSTGNGLKATPLWSTDHHGGTHSLRFDITARPVDGDAKWSPTPVTVTGGTYYTFSDWYKSSTTTAISVEYWTAGQPLDQDGTWANLFSGIAPAANWTHYQTGFTMPAGAVKALFVHFIASVGYLETDDYAITEQAAPPGFSSPMISLTFDDGSQGFYNNALPLLDAKSFKTTQYIPTGDLVIGDSSFMMTQAEISTVAQHGHEIGSHSITHPDLTGCKPECPAVPGYPSTTLTSELQNSKSFLEAIPNVGTVTGFAYPFGAYDANVIAAAKTAGYESGRSVEEGYNTKLDLEPYDIRVQNILGPTKAIPATGTNPAVPATTGTTLADFQGWVNYAKSHNYWLVIVFHEVQPNLTPLCSNPAADTDPEPCVGPFDTTVSLFQQMLDYLTTAGVGPDVMTVKQALNSTDAQIHSPIAGTVGFTPAAPTTKALLTALPTGFTDPDNDALTYAYQWSVNGTKVTGETSATFDLSKPGQGDHGQVVSVDVTATDPAGHKSTTVTGSVAIANSAPNPGSVAITPSPPKAGATVTATPAGFTDDDSDTLTYEYQWSVNGKEVPGATGAKFALTSAGTGSLVSVAVSARDGSGTLSPGVTDTVTVDNTPPTKGSVSIGPFSPKAGTVLTAIPTGFADVDGDSLTYHYQWAVNDKDIPGATAESLLESPAVGGDVVSVTVWADDGHQGGSSDTAGASATLANTPPVKGSVTMSPSSPQAGTALTAGPTGFADADGDTLSYQYAWFHNGQQIAGATGATLAGSGVTAGEIRVDVWATDGHGGTSDAATVTVTASNPPATDKEAPKVAVSSPLARAYWVGLMLPVRFSCSDSSGVASCTATIGRVGAKAMVVNNGQKVRLSSLGRYVLVVTAKDSAGNTASKSVAFRTTNDRVAPKIKIASPLAQAYRSGQTLAVRFACSDSAGIASCEATVGRVGSKPARVRPGKKVRLAAAGRYVLRVTGTDRNDNSATKTLFFSARRS